MFVYALEDGRYYISSKTMDELYKVEYGFVKMFLPKYCVEEVNCNNYEEEFKLLLKYMKRYGVNNVRGLQYQSVEFELSEILDLQNKMGYKRIFKDPVLDTIDDDSVEDI
jgi:hypothetical protein